MYHYSLRSRTKLDTAIPPMQLLFEAVLKERDHTILCGFRGPREQNEAYAANKSKVKFPHGKHNSYPSMAVDAAPYPIDWHDIPRFYAFGEFVLKKAREMGMVVRWGGDWDMDGDYDDQIFNDLVHFEFVRFAAKR